MVLGARLLGQAAVIEKRSAAQSSTYGPESRGTPCHSEVVISDAPIDYPYVTEADILLALSQEGYERFAEGTREAIFFDPKLVTPRADIKPRQLPIPSFDASQKELGSVMAANVVILGACAASTSIVKRASLEKAIEMTVAKKHLSLNLKALELGWELGREVEAHA